MPVMADVTAQFNGANVEAVVGHHCFVGCRISPPRTIEDPAPEYTEGARKRKIQGAVVLWLVVNAQGLPEQIKVKRSIDSGLDPNAVDTVKRWKFEPATRDGNPVAVAINVEVNFRL